MSIEPINPSDHIQAAMRLAQERHTQAPDDIEASRAATQAVINEQVRADRVTITSQLEPHLSPDGEAAGSRASLGAESYRAELRRRQLEDAPSVGEMSVENFEAQATHVARSDMAVDARMASEGRLAAMNVAESRPDVAVSAAALNPPPMMPKKDVGVDGRAVMAVDASAASSGLPNSKTHAARASARYKRVANLEDERMAILPRGREEGSSSDLDDIGEIR